MYGIDSNKYDGIEGMKFCIYNDKQSAIQKIRIEITILIVFFLPKYTAAKAIQPRPLAIFETNDDIFIDNKIPAIEANKAESVHEIILQFEAEIPFAVKTSLSLPVIRI